MNNLYRELQTLNENSFSFVTDSTSLCVASESQSLWLSFVFHIIGSLSNYEDDDDDNFIKQ